MRIVIDMQGAQSSGSRDRGIGRYTMSLVEGILNNRQSHEVLLALNGMFPETIETIRTAFGNLIPQENIKIWHTQSSISYANEANIVRRHSAEFIREAFLMSLRPDVIFISSLFEGLIDDATTSIGSLNAKAPTAVTLYDLIPYIHRSPYLDNPTAADWYLEKIDSLRKADLWLAISDSSRSEGLDNLKLPEEWVVNISTDADSYFCQVNISSDQEQVIRERYSLRRPFIMYTGGIDHRKNIEGLIRAFSRLPITILQSHQLAIVCAVHPDSRQKLELLVEKLGLEEESVILTGFIPEEDLRILYNICAVFVFPSWHEGFGIPALEAMRCGAPVIGANTSSLPEVIGWDEALFDPYSEEEMAKAIERALVDETYRETLIKNAKIQSEKFSWDKTSKRAIAAMEDLYAARQLTSRSYSYDQPYLKLAYVSPLPPERSGIADYSAELLPRLGKYYQIEVIANQETINDPWVKENCMVRSVQWFMDHSDYYDRVLYHFGNSTFHQHMFSLLKDIPGAIVLHDFYLSGIIAHMDMSGFASKQWSRELYFSHGYKALFDLYHRKSTAEMVWEYPCNLSVIQDSVGVIVHSPNSLRLCQQFYGGGVTGWAVVPLLRDSMISTDRTEARKFLDLDARDFLVCSFGMMGPTKLNHRLLDAWLKSDLANDLTCHLVFVGENHPGDYGLELLQTIDKSGRNANIQITGWVEREVFKLYLAAADLSVQLRTLSRGETSAAALDSMNYGIPTIINAHGSLADLDERATWKLPDTFSDNQLVEALEILRQDERTRKQMGESAREIILKEHNPQECAILYRNAIESFYEPSSGCLTALTRRVVDMGFPFSDSELIPLAESIAMSFPARNKASQLLLDISGLIRLRTKPEIKKTMLELLEQWLVNPPEGYRAEPVYSDGQNHYLYARGYTEELLDIPDKLLQEDYIEYAAGDVFIVLDNEPHISIAKRGFLQSLRIKGVKVKFVVYDFSHLTMPRFFPAGSEDNSSWLEIVLDNDGVVCASHSIAVEFEEWRNRNCKPRQRTFEIDWCDLRLPKK